MRHERDELAVGRQMLEVGKDDKVVSDKPSQLVYFLMRSLEEIVEQPELVHHFERRGMDGVAAEVAQEVGMLLEHEDIHTRTCEEKAEHHAGWSTAGDGATRGDGFARHVPSTHHVWTCAGSFVTRPPQPALCNDAIGRGSAGFCRSADSAGPRSRRLW